MVGLVASSSVVSPQWLRSCASLGSRNGHLQVLLWLCLTTFCGLIHDILIYGDTEIMHAIFSDSKSCNCNKDEYDTPHALCLWNPKNYCFVNTAPSLPQIGTEVSAAPKFDYTNSYIWLRPECTSITSGAFSSTWECSCRVWEHFAKLQGGLRAFGST
jgi:hypothetical protein